MEEQYSGGIRNPDKKLWYRVGKIVYGIGWLIVVLITSLVLVDKQPKKYVDLGKSHITCNSTEVSGIVRYSFEAIGITSDFSYDLNNYRFDANSSDNDKANYRCLADRRSDSVSDESVKALVFQSRHLRYYDAFVETKTRGSWAYAVKWAIVTFAVCSFILEFTKRVILYIATGQPINHDKWLG